MGPPGFDLAEDLIIISLRQQYKQGEFNLIGNEQIEANMSVVDSIINGSDAIIGSESTDRKVVFA